MIGSRVTVIGESGEWVVSEMLPAFMPSWRLIRWTGSKMLGNSCRDVDIAIIVDGPMIFPIGDEVPIGLKMSGIVVEDRDTEVVVSAYNRVELSSGYHSWIGLRVVPKAVVTAHLHPVPTFISEPAQTVEWAAPLVNTYPGSLVRARSRG